MPDSPESRLGRLEQQMATVEQQVRDVVADVQAQAPVAFTVVRIEEQVRQMRGELRTLAADVTVDRKVSKQATADLEAQMRAMRDEANAQARANRTQLIAGVISIITTLILVCGTIVAAGL